MIFEGDCMQIMKRLPNELFALTVTSPPYNIGKDYESVKPIDEYLNWCGAWIHEIHRLTIQSGAFWLNLGYLTIPGRAKAIPIPYLLWDRVNFYFMQEIVWNYGAGVACAKSFSPRNEKFLWYVKNPKQYTFNLDAVRDPNVKYPYQKEKWEVQVQSTWEKSNGCLAISKDHIRKKPKFQRTDKTSRAVSPGGCRSNREGMQQRGRHNLRSVFRIRFNHGSRPAE